MSQSILAQVKHLFSDSPAPIITSEASPCFQLSGHRLISRKERSKDSPASMVVATGLALAFDLDNQLNVYSLPDLANDAGIRLAMGVDVIGADRPGEITVKLVRDSNSEAAIEAWDMLVDAIENKQFPPVVKGQMVHVPRTLFLGEQQAEQQQPAVLPEESAIAP
ncbi:hypothetical protein [Nissabacter sp. SGAir0207]|uniref:hypothetical protein n=1 Tax=Nissabacter sp. SGAir0207 TaxID=2126321 RepID=UPI0010CCB445|nr:hypothetical protein [Nissabacter sp. SGAir0207]QCR38762.1 hypothetical protein C1N62_21785 [Nissabacter sp. SGAir0207]